MNKLEYEIGEEVTVAPKGKEVFNGEIVFITSASMAVAVEGQDEVKLYKRECINKKV